MDRSDRFLQGCMNAMAELTVTEASRILGLSAATVKRRLARGELIGRKETRPQGTRWLVEIDTDRIKGNQQITDSSVNGDSTSAGELTMIAWLQDELTNRRREVQELHTLLAQQTALNAGRRPWWMFWK